MNPIYKFELTANGATQQAYPVYGDDLAKTFEKVSGQEFFRAQLSGKVTFQANDYALIVSSAFDTQFIFQVYISYDGGLTWTAYWQGTFWKTDCEFDDDARTVTVQPSANDRYNAVMDGLDKEYNLIDLRPEITPVKADKRAMVQIYVPGESVVACFLSGMWWEQECEPESNTTTLQNTYRFGQGQTKKEVTVSGTLTPDVTGFYAGNVTTLQQGYECIYKNGSYVFRFRYSTGSGYVRGDWEIVRTSDNVVLWSYYASGQTPNLNPTQITMQPVSGTGASGTATVDLRDILTFGRLVLDKDTVSGLTIYDMPANDIMGDNRNYHYVSPFTNYDIKATPRLTDIPTKWGIYQPGQYYEEPLDDQYFPVGRSNWGGVSLWLRGGYWDNEANWRAQFTLRDAFPLSSVISVLLGQIAPGITHQATTDYSQFLYGTNLIGTTQTLMITPKSNVIASGYDQPAQKAPITLRNVLDMLRDCFRCYWFIDDNNRFRIEHIQYFRNGGSYSTLPVVGIDLTAQAVTRNGKVWSFAKNQYKFDKPAMAARYQFGWMDDATQLFKGIPIDIVSKYVEQSNIENVNIMQFSSDIDFILLNPSVISKDGFVLLAAVSVSGQYVLPYYTVEGMNYDNVLQNGYVAFVYLQQYYAYDMPARQYKIGGVNYTAIGIKKLKTQEINYPAIYDPDLLQLIKTQIGNGTIEKLSVNLSSRNATTTLKYDTE